MAIQHLTLYFIMHEGIILFGCMLCLGDHVGAISAKKPSSFLCYFETQVFVYSAMCATVNCTLFKIFQCCLG